MATSFIFHFTFYTAHNMKDVHSYIVDIYTQSVCRSMKSIKNVHSIDFSSRALL